MIDKILYIFFAIPFFSQLNPYVLNVIGCIAIITLPFLVIKLRILYSFLVGILLVVPIWIAISSIYAHFFISCDVSIPEGCLNKLGGYVFALFITPVYYAILYYLRVAYYFKYQRKSN